MSKSFNELVKHFNRIRPYARDFYINGFQSREEFRGKSLRSYDNERRRIESYLSEFIQTEQTKKGKVLRLHFDQDTMDTNPFFRLWQTKSFTRNDIFLHFVLLDCLGRFSSLSLKELTELIHEDYLCHFDDPTFISELTIRQKLKEYSKLGILLQEKKGQQLTYQLAPPLQFSEDWIPTLQFFKEVFPGGVIGQFLLNKITNTPPQLFSFKHHFIVHCLDEQIRLTILAAIQQKRYLLLTHANGGRQTTIAPISLDISTESGRQYVLGFLSRNRLTSIRVDFIQTASLGSFISDVGALQKRFKQKRNLSWNGNFYLHKAKYLRVLLQCQEGREDYLMLRLLKEQRMGNTRRLDSDTLVFEINLYDFYALTPFLRTFIGRIRAIETNDTKWKKRFIQDIKAMSALYFPPERSETFDE